jgi:integrase
MEGMMVVEEKKRRNKNHNMVLRGVTWHFVAKINGKKVKRALSQSITEARRLRDELLREIVLHGDIPTRKQESSAGVLFGEFALKWAKIIEKKVRISTMRDYRISMNSCILPRFGDTPIADIGYLDVETFISELGCSAKRINNVLVPMRGVFRLAEKSGIISTNIMKMVENRRTEKPQINPMSLDEVNAFLAKVNPYYRPFFEVAFFTGMRGGEMSALKWVNVDFEKKVIRIVETRVYGVEGMPKTSGSYRYVDILPMTMRALKDQAASSKLKSPYVFLNEEGKPIEVETLRKNAWSKGLKHAKIPYRPMIQTRHTFATLMILSGENLGWVQKMMGHKSLKMIINNYFSHIPNLTHRDGTLFVQEYEKKFSGDPKRTPESKIET